MCNHVIQNTGACLQIELAMSFCFHIIPRDISVAMTAGEFRVWPYFIGGDPHPGFRALV